MHQSLPPHFVRVVRSLALVTASVALPACGAAADPPLDEPHAATISTSETAEAHAPSTASPAPVSRAPLTDIPGSRKSATSELTKEGETSGALATSDDASTSSSSSDEADAGATRPHTSGPLRPPELPVRMA